MGEVFCHRMLKYVQDTLGVDNSQTFYYDGDPDKWYSKVTRGRGRDADRQKRTEFHSFLRQQRINVQLFDFKKQGVGYSDTTGEKSQGWVQRGADCSIAMKMLETAYENSPDFIRAGQPASPTAADQGESSSSQHAPPDIKMIVLFAGDSDFSEAVDKCRQLKLRVAIVGYSHSISGELKTKPKEVRIIELDQPPHCHQWPTYSIPKDKTTTQQHQRKNRNKHIQNASDGPIDLTQADNNGAPTAAAAAAAPAYQPIPPLPPLLRPPLPFSYQQQQQQHTSPMFRPVGSGPGGVADASPNQPVAQPRGGLAQQLEKDRTGDLGAGPPRDGAGAAGGMMDVSASGGVAGGGGRRPPVSPDSQPLPMAGVTYTYQPPDFDYDLDEGSKRALTEVVRGTMMHTAMGDWMGALESGIKGAFPSLGFLCVKGSHMEMTSTMPFCLYHDNDDRSVVVCLCTKHQQSPAAGASPQPAPNLPPTCTFNSRFAAKDIADIHTALHNILNKGNGDAQDAEPLPVPRDEAEERHQQEQILDELLDRIGDDHTAAAASRHGFELSSDGSCRIAVFHVSDRAMTRRVQWADCHVLVVKWGS
mmetsp:Transcript_48870/g.122385  ORF Transcript_48870/g.122385 Transcript_48870/m.122385 type:complete len:588 (+) Transcript_48870:172-1935(+)